MSRTISRSAVVVDACTPSKDLHHVVREVASPKLNGASSVKKGESLVDGDDVSGTITRVEDGTSGASRRVQGENGWVGDVNGGYVELSNMIWVMRSRLASGLRGTSVRRTGCSSGLTRSSL